MNSIVNGDIHEESIIAKTNDGVDLNILGESKSSSKIDSAGVEEISILKTDNLLGSPSNEIKNAVKESVQSCIDLTSEVNDATSTLSSEREVTENERSLLENGLHCSNSDEKKESPCNLPDSKIVNINESLHQNSLNIEGVESFQSKDTSSEVHVTTDGASEIKTDNDMSESASMDTGISDEIQSEDVPSKCDNEVGDKSDMKTDHTLETKAINSSDTLDLSVFGNDSDSQIKDNAKSIESNPLEKLNEHLNSIGSDKDSKGPKQSTTQKDTLAAQKVNCQSSNKENKNISSQGHDRFKESPDNFVFAELSNEETGFPEVFTGLVKIGRYISVKGDFTLRSTEALVESPSLVSSYLLKEPDTFPSKEKESKSEPRDFFHSAAGEILIGIGLSRVNEWFHRDMVRVKKRQIQREGKRQQLEQELASHENNYTEAKKANNVYSYRYKACKTCGFSTESSIVMEGHLLVPHITSRREYQCNFCNVIDRDPKAMLEHMEKEHKKVGRIQPPVLFFECPYCTFESNSKVKLNNHLVKCQRYFDHGVNQAPPRDFEFPALTPKPITVAVVKAYEKSLGSIQRGRGRPKKQDNLTDSMHMNQYAQGAGQSPIAQNTLTSFRPTSNSPLADSLSMQNQITPVQMPNMNIRPAHSNSVSQMRPNLPSLQIPPSNRFYQVVNSAGQVVPLMGSNHLSTSPSQFPFASNLNSNSGKKLPNSGPPFFNSSMFGNGVRLQNPPKYSPDMSVTALPKLTGPYPVPMAKQATQPGNLSMTSNSLVVCEICDGYIKDLDQLRTHMQLIHKVKIHPKMLVSRPPLNCQKCQWRFFTDQGLERHLLGAHGLVTSNMQELANKNKDAGCCTICGRVYASKLVSHMNQIHKVTLKPAHLSYKCTVCSATFNLYRLFENHVYLVHSGAAKRSSEGGRSSPSKKLKTNSEKVDTLLDEQPTNHKEKDSKDNGEGDKICIECGDDILSKKPDCKKCEKCLKSDELVQGTLNKTSSKDELRKKDKTI